MRENKLWLISGLIVGALLGAIIEGIWFGAMQEENLAVVKRLSAEIQDLNSAGTLLSEPGSTQGLDLFDSFLRISPGSRFAPAGGMGRWFIPAKVRPTIYGNPAGAQYFWIHHDGTAEGPMFPEHIQ